MSPQELAAQTMGAPVDPGFMEAGNLLIWAALVALTAIWVLKEKKLPLFGMWAGWFPDATLEGAMAR